MIRARLFAVVSAAAWTALTPLAVAQIPAAEVSTPADTYQELFHQVQTRRLFPDGKTFVDATPKRDPAAILKAYRAHARFTDAELKRFVRANFVVPEAGATPAPSAERTTLKAHVAALWPHLTREPVKPVAGGSALAMAEPFVVPGGRF
ncbi:trehalase, partial [Caulobacter sp. D4A]